jgi:integrase
MQVISEGPTKITKATVDAAWRRRKADHRLLVRDKDCRGLTLVVNSTAMRWEFAYRPRGTDPVTGRRWPNRTVTLGNPQTHSPDDARIEANRIKGQAAAGGDPAADKKAAAEAARRKRGGTVARLADGYARAFPKRPKMRGGGLPSPRYVAEELSQLWLALDAMDVADQAAADLRVDDVRILLAVDNNNRARFGALSRFLDWCQDAGHIEVNPCALIGRARRPKAPQARSHYLTPPELARLWEAAGRLSESVWRDLARFLIVVPCRRGEAARLDWSHLDVAAAEWRQPGHMTRNRDPHRLHLHELALEVLQARCTALGDARTEGDQRKAVRILAPRAPRSGLVFPAPVSGGVVDTFSDIKVAMMKATGLKDGPAEGTQLAGWTWHDFRRSFATALGEAGIPEAIADAILNHRQSATRGGVLGVYQRASRWPEQVKAMELWGRLLAAAIEGPDANVNVVPMTARAI